MRSSREVAEKRIEQKLLSPTQCRFEEVPLAAAIRSKASPRQIRFDGVAFDEADIGTDAPITMNLKGISLKLAELCG